MKLIRKFDVFKELTKYAEGKLSIGECVDNCQTYDVAETVAEVNKVIHGLNDIIECEADGLHYAKDRLPYAVEILQKVSRELMKWGYED